MASRERSVVLERVQRCRHCGAEMAVAALGYTENPYCTTCHDERTALEGGAGAVAWQRQGAYVHFLKRGS